MVLFETNNLYDVFDRFSCDEIEDLKFDETFLQQLDKEVADELKTAEMVSDNDFVIKTMFTNYGFVQVWQTKNYWLVDVGMGLGFAQYWKRYWTLQEAVDDQIIKQCE